MKIWNGYASEHSSSLEMIGHFKEVRNAAEAEALLKKLEDMVREDSDSYEYDQGPEGRRFTEEMWNLLEQENFFEVSPSDLLQFLFDFTVSRKGKKVRVATDECDISIFIKAMIRHGARVEIYSRHDYPNAEKTS